MKFPYTLSKQRQSLLSLEDRALYEYEHSPFYSYTDKLLCVNAYRQRKEHYMSLIDNDDEFSSLNESEKIQMTKALVKLEAAQVMDEFDDIVYPLVEDCISVKEYNQVKKAVKKNIDEMIENDNYSNMILNEGTPGHDITYWIPGINLGWLGRLSLGILSAGAAGLVGLFLAGKDKVAAKKLEKYMNKLVELTDSGVYKKKSFLSFFGKGKMSGDQSFPCFRSAQEIAERTIAKDTLLMGKTTGILGGNGMDDAINGQMSGGMSLFNERVVEPLKIIIGK